MRRALLWAPLVLFVVFVAVVVVALRHPDDRQHRSALIGKPFPAVMLPAGASSRPGFEGKAAGPRLVNVFASWCGPCVGEARVLGLLQARGARIDGIAIRDTVANVDRFLEANGNPYRQIGLDTESRVQLAIGSSGVPETFVVDARGIIRDQHIGPIEDDDVPGLLATLKAAK